MDQNQNTTPNDGVRIGEETFNADEARELIRLGKLAKEVETKQNTKIDKVMSAWTRDTQEKKEQAERIRQLEAQIQQNSSQTNNAQAGKISPEQMKVIREQLHEVGALTEDNVAKVVNEMVREQVSSMFAGRDLLSQAKKAIRTAEEAYGVKADLEDLLEYMNERGFRDPKDALRIKYDTEIEKAKLDRFEKERGYGVYSPNNVTRTKDPKYNIDFKDKEKVRKMISEGLAGQLK